MSLAYIQTLTLSRNTQPRSSCSNHPSPFPSKLRSSSSTNHLLNPLTASISACRSTIKSPFSLFFSSGRTLEPVARETTRGLRVGEEGGGRRTIPARGVQVGPAGVGAGRKDLGSRAWAERTREATSSEGSWVAEEVMVWRSFLPPNSRPSQGRSRGQARWSRSTSNVTKVRKHMRSSESRGRDGPYKPRGMNLKE